MEVTEGMVINTKDIHMEDMEIKVVMVIMEVDSKVMDMVKDKGSVNKDDQESDQGDNKEAIFNCHLIKCTICRKPLTQCMVK